MKKYVLLFILLWPVGASAQDVIVKRDSSTVVCRVLEVSATEVTFKKWNDQEGANYIMNLSDVVSINYENGEINKFNRGVVANNNSFEEKKQKRRRAGLISGITLGGTLVTGVLAFLFCALVKK